MMKIQPPLPLYTSEQIRALEQAVFDGGETAEQLMARAGAALFSVLQTKWPDARTVGVLLGSGQNAGDGLVLARLARAEGFRVSLFGWCRPERLHGAAHRAWMALKTAYPDVVVMQEMGEMPALGHFDVIVDAGFGIGLSRQRPLSAEAVHWIEYVNRARHGGAAVLSADLPSGLIADTGAGDPVVQADVTVCFLAMKIGLVTGRGPAVSGHIVLADLGIPPRKETPDVHVVLGAESLPPKPRDGHKGRFGTVLVVAGNRGMMGAARMAAEAALRVGAGKVIVATHPEHAATLAIGRPELIVHGLVAATSLDALLAKADAIVLGPGLGCDDWAAQMAARVLATDLPLVIDADGLGFLPPSAVMNSLRIMTPHPAEAARLLGCTVAEIEQDRLAAARALRERFGMLGVLKGAGSVIFLPDELRVCGRGSPALATAGSGDVLAGVIGGLLALGIVPAQALPRAVCWHALAGEVLAEQSGAWGAVATDLFEPIRAIANGRANLPHANVSLWP
ncbi:NAD(P)H-hydrate dehydratase [Halothiobacillus sp.]|uniref:NAD(P)H-hydrate dehydratase n=1 Tax=Halothiobacillus sp. TaxID=1891311 RepID=UPI002626526B|nr:NAD(P)H-hydrate dehydratase [Halothiobacillus sp.]MDD4966355.1 NAD(P)H-hydrate dehydratase [Halothiobacillus sp.]